MELDGRYEQIKAGQISMAGGGGRGEGKTRQGIYQPGGAYQSLMKAVSGEGLYERV